MRFYVPNMVEQEPKEDKKMESVAEGDEAEEEEDITPASIFND